MALSTFTPDIGNEMFRLAYQLVTRSNRHIFLTGKAGTGKTTFLKYIRENCHKQMAVVAPTGVAAINAGGVTIHSFFQLPLSPFIPGTAERDFGEENTETTDRHSLLSRLRLNNEKKKVLTELELLVIDEISMVRCDTLDAIDVILRYVRHRPFERFGGVQLLFIGDLLQLPPVIRDTEWQLLSPYYPGPYFFDSQVLQNDPPLYIEFDKIYRQSEEQFIRILNQVRNNELDAEGLAVLESRFEPTFRRSKHDGYIILTTHNNKAAGINTNELAQLDTKLFTYAAGVKDDFPNRAFPAEETLQLKVGAQVMFIRNDAAENGKRFFNGKIGTVSRLEDEKVYVRCEDLKDEITVQKETWENIRYTVNSTTRHLDSEVLGSFTQYPLRLAWAITIHKSQGLTFEKAIIDAGEAFAPGQVYVALSRCTSLAGMILQSRIRTSSLVNDKRIVDFSRLAVSTEKLQEELVIASKHFGQTLLLSTFDFAAIINSASDCLAYLIEHRQSFNPESFVWVESLLSHLERTGETATKFRMQLQGLFQQPIPLIEHETLHQRLSAASIYFTAEISKLVDFLNQSPAVTDSRIHAKEYNENLREIFAQLASKKFMLGGLMKPFDTEDFSRRKNQFRLPPFSVNSYAGTSEKQLDNPHPRLYQQLRKKRDSLCAGKDLPIYMVAGSNSLDEMARYLPQTPEELKNISGFGDAKINRYGDAFLSIIIEYARENNLTSLVPAKTDKSNKVKKARSDSKTSKLARGATFNETLKLFRDGYDLQAIAKTRGLAISTIESHLEKFIRIGELSINDLVVEDKRKLIEAAILEFNGGSATPVREKLGEDFSYAEIRFVRAAMELEKERQA